MSRTHTRTPNNRWLIGYLPAVPAFLLLAFSILSFLYYCITGDINYGLTKAAVLIIFLLGIGTTFLFVLLDLPLVICARDAFDNPPKRHEKLLTTGIILHSLASAILAIYFLGFVAGSPQFFIGIFTLAYTIWSLHRVYSTINTQLDKVKKSRTKK